MTKANRAKCPKCGIDLSFDPRADVAQCGSCGTTLRIEQPRWHVWRRARPENAHLPAIQAGTSGIKNMATVIVVGVLGVTFYSPIGTLLLHRAGMAAADQVLGEQMGWDSSEHPVLADVNGDGVTDVVGWVDVRKMGDILGSALAAFEGQQGNCLWKTPLLGKSSGHAAVVGDRIVVADESGTLRAFSLGRDEQLWQTPMGERVQRLCPGATGEIAVDRKDGQRVTVTLATGQAAGPNPTPEASCEGLETTDREGDSARQRLHHQGFGDHYVLPKISGMQVASAVVDAATNTQVALGTNGCCSGFPMAAAIPRAESQHEINVQPLWQRPVPAGDPLAVPEKKAEIGAISGDRVVVPYQATIANGRGRDQWRATALDMRTGRTLWDVHLSADVSGPSTIVASDRHVFFGVWNSLVVLDLATGEHRATIGGW